MTVTDRASGPFPLIKKRALRVSAGGSGEPARAITLAKYPILNQRVQFEPKRHAQIKCTAEIGAHKVSNVHIIAFKNLKITKIHTHVIDNEIDAAQSPPDAQ